MTADIKKGEESTALSMDRMLELPSWFGCAGEGYLTVADLQMAHQEYSAVCGHFPCCRC
jgi:hypothetical protein